MKKKKRIRDFVDRSQNHIDESTDGGTENDPILKIFKKCKNQHVKR